LLFNTLEISLYQLLLFPVPVIIALLFHELKGNRFRSLVQSVTYAPHFISVVVMVGMVFAFLNPGTGIVNKALAALGFEPVQFLSDPSWFKTVFVLSGEWQSFGWGTIIYLAALSAVNPDLHEAAMVDGASRLRRIWHINLPSILPTIIILLILDFGSFMAVGFEKIYLMQNPLNMGASDVIQTYVYRVGLTQGQYSYSAAIGLFNSVISCGLLVLFNRIARKTTEISLW
jgi:putative aldouronate transport system permease protein